MVDEGRREKFLLEFLSLGEPTCDLNYQSAVRFTTKDHVNLQLKTGCTVTDQFFKKCSSSREHVWMNGSHPTTPGSVHVMEVCINKNNNNNNNGILTWFNSEYCRCERKDIFFVELCTTEDEDGTKDAFYVYRLFPLFKSKGNNRDAKDCTLKHCTRLHRRAPLYPLN